MYKLTKQLDLMWATLEEYQEQANYDGHGESWARMCKDRTGESAYDAMARSVASELASAAAWNACSASFVFLDCGYPYHIHDKYALLAIKCIKEAQETKGVKCQF
jgi:hypothetical protein